MPPVASSIPIKSSVPSPVVGELIVTPPPVADRGPCSSFPTDSRPDERPVDSLSPMPHNDGGNQFGRRPFRTWLSTAFRRKQQSIFPLHQGSVEAHDCGGFSTMLELTSRAGCTKLAQSPAMTRSMGRRFGARSRERLRIRS
jgi:hypothetical protein